MVRIRCGSLYPTLDSVEVSVVESQRADEVVKRIVEQLQIGRPTDFELAEALLVDGQVCKERRLEGSEKPAKLQALWPKTPSGSSAGLTAYDFFIRRKEDSVKLGIWFDAKELHSTSAIVDSLLKPKQRDYADLCNLPDLNEKTMLSTLKKRFQDGQIYTYVGSILIAMNPFRFLPIYNPKHMKIYERCQLPDLPPHIFAIADSAYQSMLQTKTDQCIVISGESGSGKTESTNLLLHHLLHLSQKGSSEGGIEQVIAAAGPVLKAFGNAKTVHNDNSSRFGFFIQLSFKENGFVQKAVLEKYLLEKSRIVSQSRHERNYHIFYYLLAGLEETEKDSLLLTNPSAYHYLNQTDCFTISSGVNNECVDESQEFLRLVQSMDLVSFSVDVRKKIFAVLAAVLHLGNIEYTLNTENNFHDSVSIKNPETVKIVCDLLKVPETELVEALKQKKTRAGTETLRKSYKINDAVATRDSMAKCVYAALFDWIVLQINKALMSRTDLKIHHGNTIGLLDIFGFEDFDINSFEQFCINYANEHLHFYFNQHVFKLEQEEYRSEGIQWNDIDYIDNTECLHLFAKKPTGLLYLLDEECSFPGGTNESLLEKFNANHSNNAHFGVSVKKQKIFTICHYAGQVNYSIVDFREKNLDTMPQDLLTILKHSKLPLVRELVGYDMVALFRWSCLRAFFMAVRAFLDSGRRHKKMGSVKRKRSVPLDNRLATAVATSNDTLNVVHKPVFASKSMPVNGTQDVAATVAVSEAVEQANQIIEKSRLLRAKVKTDVRRRNDVAVMKSMVRKSLYASRQNKAISVGSQFNNSLQRLVDTLSRANPLFIRCIKSNNLKTPLEFDDNVVLRQLRYTGMLATINIRKSGYNYRLKFQDFIQQYCVILPRGMLSSRDDILALFQSLDINEQNYQLGKTKVFFREWEKLLLDQAMNAAIMNRVIKIQRFFKKSLNRLSFLQKKSAAVVLQSGVRMLLAKKRLHELRLQMYAAIRIQRMFRRYRMRRSIRQQQHTAATCIQSHYRGYQTRKNVALLRENSKKDIIDGHVESILNKTNVESFDGEYELETPLEVIEGSIDELKPKFSLYDDNDIFEYRPKDVYKIIRKPDNSCHSDSMISDTGRESSLADDERDDAFDGKITGRESSLADDERDDAFDEKTETEQVDDDVFNNKKSVEDSGYMKSFDEERFSLKIKLPVQNPPEEIPLRTISKSISDSYLMEMAAGLDAVRLTDKKVKAPIAIAETAEDEEEENIDLEIPLEVPADEDEDEQTSSQTSGKTRPNKGLQRSLPQLHEISGKQPHSKFVRKIKKIVTGLLAGTDYLSCH